MINLKAINWKYPGAYFSVHGALEYRNIHWYGELNRFSEAEAQQADVEYMNYMGNVLPVEQAKEAQKEALIRLKLESMLFVEFAQIDAAKTKDEIKAVKLK